MNTTTAPSAWSTDTAALFVGWTTFPARDDAERVARVLISEDLAACAQVEGPIRSLYKFQGKLNEDEEFRLTLKFTRPRAESLEKRLRELHPYTTPQWIAVRADRVSPDYLAWAAGG